MYCIFKIKNRQVFNDFFNDIFLQVFDKTKK